MWKRTGYNSADGRITSTHEVCNPICVAGAGAGDRGDGVGADGDEVCDSRTGGCGASVDRACAGGSGAGGGVTWTANLD